jgi:16S rRNA (guanine1516-N2)-methyltransferase
MILISRVYVTFLSLCAVTDAFFTMSRQEFEVVSTTHDKPFETKPLFISESRDPESENRAVDNTFCVLADREEFREDAERIADSLGMSLFSSLDGNHDGEDSNSIGGEGFSHALRLVPYEYGDLLSTFALAIEPIGSDAPEASNGKRKQRRKPKKSKVKSSSSSSFFVDLCPPPNSKAGRRASGDSGKADLLVKAVAPRKGAVDPSTGAREAAVVWDLTAGLGQDSLVLARNGAKTVRMVERHPIVAALLGDAMRRLELLAKASPVSHASAGALLETLGLSVGEGRDALEDGSGCDVVYLDPMFPPRQKQSAVKKGMSILHGLLETHVVGNDGGDETLRQREEQEFLEAALEAARLRVVVKRPIKAPLLGDGSTKPSHALNGSVNRWDVYVSKAPPAT